MLNFLSSGEQKQIVGISLIPGIGLQAAIIDKATMSVLNFSSRKIEYNFSTREIQNYPQLKSAIAAMLDEMRVPAKAPVYFVLPNVYFDFIELPAATTEADLKNIFLSKAEDFYLFKKEEPLSGWFEAGSASEQGQIRWAYSSIQKSVVESLREITSDLGLVLVGVESEYSAILRGLRVSGICDDAIYEGAAWGTLLINSNSYVLFQLDGNRLIKLNEVPIATRSFTTEEAYDSIVSSVSQLLQADIYSRLYIISQTDEISADLLKNYLDYQGPLVVINANKFSNEPIINVKHAAAMEEINKLSLSTIAASFINKKNASMMTNVIADDPNASLGVYFTVEILGQEVEITNSLITKVAIMLSSVIGLVLGSMIIGLYLLTVNQTKQIQDMNKKTSELDVEISKFSEEEKKPEVDISNIIDIIAKQNISAISYYDSIATDIPKNVWLTKYYNKAGEQIAITGVAQNITDIYEYYKNLRVISPESNLKLADLRVITDSPEDSDDARYISSLIINKDTDRLYSFEISNLQVDFEQQQVQDLNRTEEGKLEENMKKLKEQEAVIIRRQGSPAAPAASPEAPVESTSSQMTPAQGEQ